MDEWEELRSYVGFDEEDRERLRALWPHVEPRVEAMLDHFYLRVLAFEGARRVLEDDAQVQRLRRTLRGWVRELFLGERDAAYVERRRRIGWRHVQVGLDARYMHTAMQVLADDLVAVAVEALGPREGLAACRAVHRATSLDLALMTGGYVATREKATLEALQELLVEHVRTLVILVDAEGRVVTATRSLTRWLDGTPVLGKPWREVLPAELIQGADLERVMRDAGESGEARHLPRVDVRSSAGTRSFQVDVVPIRHALADVLVQLEELTDTVDLEGRLRRSEALAQLGALSAAVAHELRNPLAGISGAIQVISRGIPKDAPYAPVMAKVEREIRRLDALVSDLLAFARPGAVSLERVELSDPVAAAADWAREDFPRVEVEVRGRGVAQADAHLVQQILLNLLQNAAQAMGEEGKVLVELGPSRIAVSDSGPGVPAELGERVFEPFTTTKVRGTGLGLAICTRNAVAMGGRLSLATGPLPGACFVLELPRAVRR
jgi:signal transduction histidine kinase